MINESSKQQKKSTTKAAPVEASTVQQPQKINDTQLKATAKRNSQLQMQVQVPQTNYICA